jgi:hypothetical protein
MGKRIIKKEMIISEKKDNNLCETNYILVNNKLEKIDYSCKKTFITKLPYMISSEDILQIYNINTKEDFDNYINNFAKSNKSDNEITMIINSWIIKNINFIKKDSNIFINILMSSKKIYKAFNKLSNKEFILKIKKYMKENIIDDNNYNINFIHNITDFINKN